MASTSSISVPENFQKIITDMTSDFTTTFPEFSFMWSKWCVDSITETEVKYLYEYVLSVYPERFFDILYQKESIFIVDGTTDINTFFLPGIDFKLLFNCNGISENTRKVMWNYLQLILFTILGSVQDKSRFGDTGNIFDNVSEKELLDKLTETMSNMSDFFKNMTGDDNTNNTEDQDNNQETEKESFNFEKMNGIPNIQEIHEHLKGLFDGKIGTLAKELAEEITNDFTSILGNEDMSEIRSTQDVIKKILSDPSKISGLVKTISDKLSKKIESGDISQEEMIKEATDIFSKMGGIGGMDKFKDMFKGMGGADGMDGFKDILKNMGGMGGLAGMMGGMGGAIPKNSRIDTNAMKRMSSTQNTREKLKARMLKKRAAEVESFIKQNQSAAESAAESISFMNAIPEELLSNNGVSSGISSTPSKKKKKNKNKK